MRTEQAWRGPSGAGIDVREQINCKGGWFFLYISFHGMLTVAPPWNLITVKDQITIIWVWRTLMSAPLPNAGRSVYAVPITRRRGFGGRGPSFLYWSFQRLFPALTLSALVLVTQLLEQIWKSASLICPSDHWHKPTLGGNEAPRWKLVFVLQCQSRSWIQSVQFLKKGKETAAATYQFIWSNGSSGLPARPLSWEWAYVHAEYRKWESS